MKVYCGMCHREAKELKDIFSTNIPKPKYIPRYVCRECFIFIKCIWYLFILIKVQRWKK